MNELINQSSVSRTAHQNFLDPCPCIDNRFEEIDDIITSSLARLRSAFHVNFRWLSVDNLSRSSQVAAKKRCSGNGVAKIVQNIQSYYHLDTVVV